MTKDELYESLIEKLLEENKKIRSLLRRADVFVACMTFTVNGASIAKDYQDKAQKLGKEMDEVLMIKKEEEIRISPLKEEFENLKNNQ